MYKGVSIFFLSVLLFTGCAKTNAEYNSLRNDKQNVVKTFSTLSEKNIEDGKEITIELGVEDKEIIVLEKQRVFASKFNLPKISRPFSVDIVSSSSAGFFAPKILFLNKKDKILRTTQAKDLQFDRGFFKGTVFVNNGYRKIHSIIVTQDLKELTSKHKINYVSSVPIIVPVGPYVMTYMYSTGDQNKTIQNAYGGNIKLKFKVYSPSKIGDK